MKLRITMDLTADSGACYKNTRFSVQTELQDTADAEDINYAAEQLADQVREHLVNPMFEAEAQSAARASDL